MTNEELQAKRVKITQTINEASEGGARGFMAVGPGTYDVTIRKTRAPGTTKLIGGEIFALVGASLHGDEIVLKLKPTAFEKYELLDVPLSEVDSFAKLRETVEQICRAELVAMEEEEFRMVAESNARHEARVMKADVRKRAGRYDDNFGSW
ncbi:hypothetical protein ACODYM_28735 [Burkholderia gladioli]|uniref:hypothetical protein n=1 Tax=Burkholderia gladioli TaxID=28095 RepID=UPI003B508DA2